MSIRVWGTSLLMFLSTVTAVGQTANRYLKAPLPNDWEEYLKKTGKKYRLSWKWYITNQI